MPTNDAALAQHARVQAQFGKSARSYLTSPNHAKGDELHAMLELAAPVSGLEVLDVATGAGHTAITFAEAGAEVTATDITPEMLEVTRQHAADKDLTVVVGVAAAEQLPFADASFDVVTCRIAAHHCADVPAFVREAARVLRPAGKLLIVDNIAPENTAPENTAPENTAPEDESLALLLNDIEKRRDPSHVQVLSLLEWLHIAAEVGLGCMYVSRWTRSKNFVNWCDRMHMAAQDKQALERDILQLENRAKQYFGVKGAATKVTTLNHEVALLLFTRVAFGSL